MNLQLLLFIRILMYSERIKWYVGKSLVYFHINVGLLTKLKHDSIAVNECRFLIKTNALLS